jgi:hypothetical protein
MFQVKTIFEELVRHDKLKQIKFLTLYNVFPQGLDEIAVIKTQKKFNTKIEIEVYIDAAKWENKSMAVRIAYLPNIGIKKIFALPEHLSAIRLTDSGSLPQACPLLLTSTNSSTLFANPVTVDNLQNNITSQDDLLQQYANLCDLKDRHNNLLLAEHKILIANYHALKLVAKDLISVNDEPDQQLQTGMQVNSSFSNLEPLPSTIHISKNRQSSESVSRDELIQQYAKLCTLKDSHPATLMAQHEKLTIEYQTLYQVTKKLIADNLKLFVPKKDRDQQLQTEPAQQVGSNYDESASSKRRRLR